MAIIFYDPEGDQHFFNGRVLNPLDAYELAAEHVPKGYEIIEYTFGELMMKGETTIIPIHIRVGFMSFLEVRFEISGNLFKWNDVGYDYQGLRRVKQFYG